MALLHQAIRPEVRSFRSALERSAVRCLSLKGIYASARNILQHNLSYTSTPDFRKSLPASLLPLLDRLLEMQRLVEGQEMEYSQDA